MIWKFCHTAEPEFPGSLPIFHLKILAKWQTSSLTGWHWKCRIRRKINKNYQPTSLLNNFTFIEEINNRWEKWLIYWLIMTHWLWQEMVRRASSSNSSGGSSSSRTAAIARVRINHLLHHVAATRLDRTLDKKLQGPKKNLQSRHLSVMHLKNTFQKNNNSFLTH